jgi:putative oxidoreductase
MLFGTPRGYVRALELVRVIRDDDRWPYCPGDPRRWPPAFRQAVPFGVFVTSDRALLVLRLLSGGVFVAFGAGKFVNRASELASFKAYGLPAPAVFVIVVGVLELVGGALLIIGLFTRLVALALAGDMVGAIIVSGIARGEPISLTLAPVELGAMLVLLWTGPGAHALRPTPAPDRAF